MAITSLEKGWLEVNDKLCEIFGYPRDELVKLKWVDIAYPDDVKQERINFNQVLMGEIDGYSMDTRFIRKDGKIIYASVSVRAVRSKIAEIKLQESEKRIHLIADSLPPLISYIGQDHHFKFNNKRYEDWFKISRNEITGKHVKELLGQKGYDLIKNHLETALSGQRVVYETLMPYKYGQSRYIHLEFLPDIKPDKEVEGIFVLRS
jgi:PAS domain S-box-containing protein